MMYQLVVPMSGVGKRFRDAGYVALKPLITLENQSIISHIFDHFVDASRIVFIINSQEPDKEVLIRELRSLRADCIISEISPHKLGPSYAILQAEVDIDTELPTIVSYCDFGGIWSTAEFLETLKVSDAVVLTYTGFHPHMLRCTEFGYVKLDSSSHVVDYREKHSFTDDPMSEFASAGLYGFRTGELLIKAIRYQIENVLSTKNEFYVSLAFMYLIKNQKRIAIQNMDYFFQWGTPEDLHHFRYWRKAISSSFMHQIEKPLIEGTAIILAGGLGNRLKGLGLPDKPLVEICGQPIWKYSAITSRQIVVGSSSLCNRLATDSSNLTVVPLRHPTRGQAESALHGLRSITDESIPVSILSSDCAWKPDSLSRALEISRIYPIVLWCAKEYPPSELDPIQFTWVETIDGIVTTHYKKRPSSIANASILIGNFTFQSAGLAQKLINEILKSGIQINGEFYLDSVIDVAKAWNLEIGFLEVENYFSIGTKDEYLTAKYFENVERIQRFVE